MKSLNVCFIGYGSIAKRHIKNLHSLCKIKKINLNIDILRHENCNNNIIDKVKFVNKVKYNKLGIDDKYDIIFITNPTSEHYKTLKRYKHNAKMFFVEKPLVNYSDINKIKRLKIDSNKIYVACPLRYNSVVQYVKKMVRLNNVISVRVICSSYLPEWRKGIDYKKTYSAMKKMGGGVRLDLIHEWDYVKYLFGSPDRIICCYGKYSNLKIDSEDIATYIGEYKDKLIELHIDYFGRVNQRKVEIYTNDDVIVADLNKCIVEKLKGNETINFKEKRDDYQIKELDHFLKIYYKLLENDNNLKESINVINLTAGKI